MLEFNWGLLFTVIDLLILYVLLRKFLFGRVNAIIQEQLNLSVAIIKENADKMAQLVDTLMEKTHLNKQEIQEVLND